MNSNLTKELDKHLKAGELYKAIELAEDELRKLPTGDFHKVLGRDLLHSTSEMADFINRFYEEVTSFWAGKSGIQVDKVMQINPVTFTEVEVERTINWDNKKLKAIYGEMNGFTINTDKWFVDLFAYSDYKGIDGTINWLSDYEYDTLESFTVSGFEDLQEIFQDYMDNKKWQDVELTKAFEVCEPLIILRLQELFRQAFLEGSARGFGWSKLPLLATAHEYDLMYNAGSTI